jgi:ABC-type multidrug transport system ATPase subunit
LDEIFDNLDDIGCQKILDLITTKLYDISSIFIISHHGNELNIPYDDKIKIIKDNNGVTRLDS